MKRIKIEHKKKKTRLRKARNRYTLLFFAIIFPFFFVVMGIIYFISVNGVSLHELMNPLTATSVLGLICIITGYIVSFTLMNMLHRPLEMVSEASQKVAHGNYDIQLEYKGQIEELNTTIENFNFMVQELSSVEIMRQDFIANVSHEFNTPLSSISGYVTLLQDSELSEDERNEYVQMVLFNIEKLNDLTGNILQLSKLENQNTLEEPVSYQLDEQLREAIVMLEPKWCQKNINLELDLPKTYYSGQKSLLFQVWTNLIGNAIKFTPPNGTIIISIKSTDNLIEVNISDTGIGMTEDTINHIFEKFYQGDSSRTAQGNGLGLALCKKIIELSDGHISVVSKLGEGSTFTVSL